jgi:hypothetical protein
VFRETQGRVKEARRSAALLAEYHELVESDLSHAAIAARGETESQRAESLLFGAEAPLNPAIS